MSTTTDTNNTNAAKDGDDNMDMTSLKKLLMDTKVDGNESLWGATLKTFGMAEGKTKKGDVKVPQMDQAVELLRSYAETQEVCWDLVPLEQFRATKEDFYLAFLQWAEQEGTINVSKAIRRMTDYFKWMSDNRKDLEEPLTVDSIREPAKCWDIQVTHDEQGHFLWWIDFSALDRTNIQKIPNKDHLRYVVWFAHLVMFDPKARQNGAYIIEDLAHVGFWKLATMVPHDLNAKMKRMTIGILPVRIIAIDIFGAETWIHVVVAMMKPFMGKKMRERMNLLPNKTQKQKFCDDKYARKNIPIGFGGIQGEAPRDAVLEMYSN